MILERVWGGQAGGHWHSHEIITARGLKAVRRSVLLSAEDTGS